MERRRVGAHEQAVKRDIARLLPENRRGAQAILALEIARQLDRGDASLRDFATVSAQYQAILATLMKLQEPAAVLDPVEDQLRQRRERRERRLGAGAAG